MARPRVFISSTYYDLKHVRSSLELFVKSLGFDCILSEKGSIAYAHDMPLDESCYREVATADIFVLIVGGHYGTESSSSSGAKNADGRSFFDQYDSITKSEYKSAVERDIPIYVLVEKQVFAEFRTFQKNVNTQDITYAHVEPAAVSVLNDGGKSINRCQ